MEGLGIDIKILVGQMITFGVLLFLLKKFAYKPFLTILEIRRKKIEEGIKKTDEAEKSLEKIRGLAEEVKEAGERKSKELILSAEKKANEKTKSIMANAEAEKAKIIENAKIAMAKEQAQAKERQQKEAIELALSLTEKVLKEKITKDQDKKMIERLTSELK